MENGRKVAGEQRRGERSETSGKQKKREYRLESIVERGHRVRRSDLLSSVRRLDYVVNRAVQVCARAHVYARASARGCTGRRVFSSILSAIAR